MGRDEVFDAIEESLRLVRAHERLVAAMHQRAALALSLVQVLEVAPDLAPEVDEAQRRINELGDHLLAASDVVVAKIEQVKNGLAGRKAR